jgi:hypothetical protein
MGPITATPPALDNDLQALIDAWPTLSEPVKAGIVAMVKVAGGSRN